MKSKKNATSEGIPTPPTIAKEHSIKCFGINRFR